MKVLSPSDDLQTKWAIEEATKINGPVYIRLCRLATPTIYEDKNFEFGKGIQHGEGTETTVFATGDMVSRALQAKEELEKQGVDIRVVDIHTIKPIDKEIIIKCAKETKKLISIEDHSVIGGLRNSDFRNLDRRISSKTNSIGNSRHIWKIWKSRRIIGLL